MRQIEVEFKTKNGNITTRRINSSSSIKKSVECLADSLPKCWTVVSRKVVKEWHGNC